MAHTLLADFSMQLALANNLQKNSLVQRQSVKPPWRHSSSALFAGNASRGTNFTTNMNNQVTMTACDIGSVHFHGGEGESNVASKSETIPAAGEIPYHYYPTNQKPKILIISNDQSTNPLPRYKKDVEKLEGLWNFFGCKVESYDNVRKKKMWQRIKTFATDILKGEESYCGVFILSHGGYEKECGDVIFGTDEGEDGFISVDEILRLFYNTENKNLQEMPKFFVFQCCRGGNKPQGVPKGSAAAGSTDEKLPQVSDTLVMYATQPKDVAIVDDDGSWLIKALVEIFRSHYEDEHLADMLTMVNCAVAKQIVEKSSDTALIGVKCMSEIRSTLRYKLKIKPPQQS